MLKVLLGLTLVAAVAFGAPVRADDANTGQIVAPRGDVILAAYRKQKKRISARVNWCQQQSAPASCKFCSLTYYGYCQCVYDFPCF